jgi:hypothetical protein
MIVKLNAPQATDCHSNRSEGQGGSSPQVIDFFAARDRMLGQTKGSTGSIDIRHRHHPQKIFLSRELSHPIYDPMKDWLNSLISGAALAALLTGILCLPSMTPSKAENFQPRPVSREESPFLAQKPS